MARNFHARSHKGVSSLQPRTDLEEGEAPQCGCDNHADEQSDCLTHLAAQGAPPGAGRCPNPDGRVSRFLVRDPGRTRQDRTALPPASGRLDCRSRVAKRQTTQPGETHSARAPKSTETRQATAFSPQPAPKPYAESRTQKGNSFPQKRSQLPLLAQVIEDFRHRNLAAKPIRAPHFQKARAKIERRPLRSFPGLHRRLARHNIGNRASIAYDLDGFTSLQNGIKLVRICVDIFEREGFQDPQKLPDANTGRKLHCRNAAMIRAWIRCSFGCRRTHDQNANPPSACLSSERTVC
jgi:hypothetical protein